jgi:hypothetical protein
MLCQREQKRIADPRQVMAAISSLFSSTPGGWIF